MRRRIGIHFGDLTLTATLLSNAVADAIWRALPLEAEFNTWGCEYYFDTGVLLEPAETQPTVEVGDLAYWPPGRAFCLFFGPTPASRGSEIRPASPVAVFGKLDHDPAVLRRVRGSQVRVTAV